MNITHPGQPPWLRSSTSHLERYPNLEYIVQDIGSR